MRILFIFHTPWIKGGASKSGLTLAKGLQERGIDLRAVCPAEGSLSEELRKNGIPVEIFAYDWAYPYFDGSLKGILKFPPKILVNKIRNRHALDKLTEFALSFKPDIVHTNSGVADIGIRLAERLNVPHISHFREFGWKDCNAIMWHEKRMRKYPLQHGIAISKDILKWHTRPKDDNVLIYNGIVPDTNHRLSIKREFWFLFVGGIFREKGIEDLLTAYSMLSEDLRNKHRLKIAGSAVDESYMKGLLTLTEQLGIKQEVDWLGEISNVGEMMQRAKALVVPSHNEAFGRIVVEGMINSCPVIGRNCAGIKEQFDNGLDLTSQEIGLRFNTIEELKSIIERIATTEISDSKELMAMISAAKTAAEELYSIRSYVDRVKILYDTIINK